MVTTFIVDDSRVYRNALARVLTSVKGVQIVGHASTGKGGAGLHPPLRPEVVILDLFMPDMSGIEVLRTMRCEAIPSMVIIVTNHADSYSRDVCRLGADLFLDKSLESQKIAPYPRVLGQHILREE